MIVLLDTSLSNATMPLYVGFQLSPWHMRLQRGSSAVTLRGHAALAVGSAPVWLTQEGLYFLKWKLLAVGATKFGFRMRGALARRGGGAL